MVLRQFGVERPAANRVGHQLQHHRAHRAIAERFGVQGCGLLNERLLPGKRRVPVGCGSPPAPCSPLFGAGEGAALELSVPGLANRQEHWASRFGKPTYGVLDLSLIHI